MSGESDPLGDLFPNLRTSPYEVTSAQTPVYNCIAWAAGDESQWWWPASGRRKRGYWPEGVPREPTVAAFQLAYGTLGYEPCADDSLEEGYEKIAIYVGPDGLVTHAARQVSDGQWTSKLGELNDIRHSLIGLEGKHYGNVEYFMRRRRTVHGPGKDAEGARLTAASRDEATECPCQSGKPFVECHGAESE